jgi:hypothetical protein
MKNKHLDGQASQEKRRIVAEKAEEFYCFRCGVTKKSKNKYEWHTTEGIKIICNGCNRELVAMPRVAPD